MQLKNLSEKLKSNNIAHKLWIEQTESYPTCLASKPYPKSVVSIFFKKLKLCKFSMPLGPILLGAPMVSHNTMVQRLNEEITKLRQEKEMERQEKEKKNGREA
ncbi:hypothetical protein R6Q57_022493 [Mikania cordata]